MNEPVEYSLLQDMERRKSAFLLLHRSRAVWTFLRQEGSPDGSDQSRNQLCVGVIKIEINSLAGAKAEASGKLITGL